MMPLLDTSPGTLRQKAEEYGFADYGQLMTPATGFTLADDVAFAIDNGTFSGFHADLFVKLLDRCVHAKSRCLWVAVPDVVGSARRTLEVFTIWKQRLQSWPLALVIQDGIEDLEIPWWHVQCVFVGGTDRFKQSREVEHIINAAQILGKGTHAGRVNSVDRWQRFDELGVDTFDGTGVVKFPDTRHGISQRKASQHLFPESIVGHDHKTTDASRTRA